MASILIKGRNEKMTLQRKENILKQLTTNLKHSINGLTFQRYHDERDKAEWLVIRQHSLAKTSKTLAEQYYAPQPLPPELSQNLNARIETSRTQLIRILKEQNDVFHQDL